MNFQLFSRIYGLDSARRRPFRPRFEGFTLTIWWCFSFLSSSFICFFSYFLKFDHSSLVFSSYFSCVFLLESSFLTCTGTVSEEVKKVLENTKQFRIKGGEHQPTGHQIFLWLQITLKLSCHDFRNSNRICYFLLDRSQCSLYKRSLWIRNSVIENLTERILTRTDFACAGIWSVLEFRNISKGINQHFCRISLCH